ncbi:MAG: HAMP domain-containing sensor histidine kinase [Polyangiales bacterium]
MEPRAKALTRWAAMAAIVAASGFLGWWTWRTTTTLERLGERSVMDTTLALVGEKLKSVERGITSADDAVVHAVDPDDLDALAARFPALTVLHPTARAAVILDAAERPLRAVSRVSPDDAARYAALVDERLRGELHLQTLPLQEPRHWHGAVAGQTALATYVARESAGRRYYVVIETDLDFVRRDVLPRLFDDPIARRRFNVTDEQGRIVYGRSLTTATEFLVSARFPTTLYKWRLTVIPQAATALEAGARSRRLIEAGYVSLSLLVIVAGVFFFAFAAREQERLNQLKSDFIATVSHELKTPLALIRMFGEMLATERVPTPEKRQQYLDIIVRESERLTALIENVLDFARLERGRIAFDFAPGDLGGVVFRGVEMFRYRLVKERPNLVTDLAADLPRMRLDERALQLLLFNLLDNAVKYAPDSEHVFVRVRQERRGVVLEVEDQGPGIDPEDARRIFERFYRGRTAQSSGARGSGIGLALVKHIARAHGGDVSVHPAPLRGSLFRVTLPVDAVPPDEDIPL